MYKIYAKYAWQRGWRTEPYKECKTLAECKETVNYLSRCRDIVYRIIKPKEKRVSGTTRGGV